jgi:hypothetical protein
MSSKRPDSTHHAQEPSTPRHLMLRT